MQTPDGIEDLGPGKSAWDRHSSPISFLVLGSLLALAMTGVLGGQPSPRQLAEFEAATLMVKTPTILRNGEFFETEIEIASKAALEDATVAISSGLWRDTTVNTMIPAATDESFEKGRFRFAYGPLAAGKSLRIKIDGQINPPLFAGNKGKIEIFDGDRLIGAMPITIAVRP